MSLLLPTEVVIAVTIADVCHCEESRWNRDDEASSPHARFRLPRPDCVGTRNDVWLWFEYEKPEVIMKKVLELEKEIEAEIESIKGMIF